MEGPEQKMLHKRAPLEKLKMFEKPKAPEWAVFPPDAIEFTLVSSSNTTITATPTGNDPFMFVGSGPASHIKIDSDPKVARLHAGVLVDESGVWYVVGFSGTTSLNGSPVIQLQPTELKEGDEIAFNGNGPYKVEVRPRQHQKRRQCEDAVGEKEQEEPKEKVVKKEEPREIRCCHLLVKHRESRRPASWKSPKITRSKEEAVKILKGFRERIASGEVKFQDLARKESDCSSAKNGGDLGPFGRGVMQKEFEDAAFALEVGQMSDIVMTQSGAHIILRIE